MLSQNGLSSQSSQVVRIARTTIVHAPSLVARRRFLNADVLPILLKKNLYRLDLACIYLQKVYVFEAAKATNCVSLRECSIIR